MTRTVHFLIFNEDSPVPRVTVHVKGIIFTHTHTCTRDVPVPTYTALLYYVHRVHGSIPHTS